MAFAFVSVGIYRETIISGGPFLRRVLYYVLVARHRDTESVLKKAAHKLRLSEKLCVSSDFRGRGLRNVF